MKKLFSMSKAIFILGIVFLQWITVSEVHAQPDIMIGSATGVSPGETTNLPVSFVNDGSVVSMDFDITFDNSFLTLGAPIVDPGLAPHTIITSLPDANTLRIVVSPPIVNPLPAINDGTIFTVPVTVNASTPAGSYSLTLSNVTLGDASASSVPVDTLTNGNVQVGEDGITIPNVVGQTQQAATSTLTGLGLTVTTSNANSTTVPKGIVISQSPGAGTSVSSGSTVNLLISNGPSGTPTANAKPIPTLSFWGLLGLSALMPGIVAFVNRKKKPN